MFKSLRSLDGFRLSADDGEIGHVTDLYFEDNTWVVRYLIVSTGSWLVGKKVLVSPNAVSQVKWDKSCICVNLTMEQVRDSPDIDTDRPISRQQEAQYHLYYNFPPYWGGVALWGRYDQPGGAVTAAESATTEADSHYRPRWDSHLRSANEVRGYTIAAVDGEAGHLDNFLMEGDNWAIRYLVINTAGIRRKHAVLLTPKLVDKVLWQEATVNVNASKQLIETAPEYKAGVPIEREFEESLFAHYTTHPYWESE